jgi:hypothetical protein
VDERRHLHDPAVIGLHRGRRGQGLAEFALVVPIFLLLAFALVDLARGIYIYAVISDAAREGARYAIVHGSKATEDVPPNVATGPGTGDEHGTTYVVPKTRELAYGLDTAALGVGVCWGHECAVPADCGQGTNTALGPVPNVPVTVRACYAFQAITGSFLRLGPIPLAAEATLTITH